MRLGASLQRTMSSFMAVPAALLVFFLLIAAAAHILDRADPAWLRPSVDAVRDHLFRDPAVTGTALAAIAIAMMVVTSISLGVLALVLQQETGSPTDSVVNQFLRSRLNQLCVGFFLGATAYALVVLASVAPTFNPVRGAVIALVLAVAAPFVLLLVVHSTVSRLRPAVVISAIHDRTLAARHGQRDLIGRTRRPGASPAVNGIPVIATRSGYVAGLDLDAMGRAIEGARIPVEVEIAVSIGSYLAVGDRIATVRPEMADGLELLAAVRNAVLIQWERRPDHDPAYGIELIEMIGWHAISSARQDPSLGKVAIHGLRDLLARWAGNDQTAESHADVLPIVYPDDVMVRLLGAFESLAVVSSESMQHQTYAEILRALAVTFERLPLRERLRVEDLVLRSLSGLGDHVLTTDLDESLSALLAALERTGSSEAVTAVRRAQTDLAASIGTLNTRTTRVPGKV